MIIEKLRMPARVGVYPHEKDRTQTICLSLEVGLPEQGSHVSDALEDTICYMAVTEAVRTLALSRHFNLVETLAEQVAQEVLGYGARWVSVRVGKVGIVAGAQAVEIAITRRAECYDGFTRPVRKDALSWHSATSSAGSLSWTMPAPTPNLP
ncbi:dihydroneopterin aldolase [Duganella guangzhouensis]|nr:dihydroneopterin aldolase [Duganella guangzhouensis]